MWIRVSKPSRIRIVINCVVLVHSINFNPISLSLSPRTRTPIVENLLSGIPGAIDPCFALVEVDRLGLNHAPLGAGFKVDFRR